MPSSPRQSTKGIGGCALSRQYNIIPVTLHPGWVSREGRCLTAIDWESRQHWASIADAGQGALVQHAKVLAMLV